MDLLLTNIGADLASQGFITGEFPKISKVKFGDGGGRTVTHKSTDTHLVNIVYETEAVAGLREERVVNVVAVVPIEIGGFTVREIGLFTSDDKMVAVTKVCDFPKPNMGDDPTHQTIYMRITISDTQCIDIDFNTDIIYASQQALDEANEHIQILYDELRKKKLLMLNASSVKLNGDLEFLGVENKYFSYTGVYTGDGASTGQAINIGMSAKEFNKKNNGSGYWLDYNSTTNTLLVKDDNDNIVREGDISFPSIKAEIYRYDAASDRFRYSSVIGLDRSLLLNTGTGGGETVSNHILGMDNSNIVVSKVVNTLNAKFMINAKYMNRIRWYTANDGGVWIQTYNLETDYFMMYGRVLDINQSYDIRNPLKKPIDFLQFKGLTTTMSNHIAASALGETRRYAIIDGVNISSTTLCFYDFSSIDNFLLEKAISAGIYQLECFANSKYMYSGTFTMSSASDNILTIRDIDGVDRVVSAITYKAITTTDKPVRIYNKNLKVLIRPYSADASIIKTNDLITIKKGMVFMDDYTTLIANNQLYHYVVEFDSELDTKIKTIGVL